MNIVLQKVQKVAELVQQPVEIIEYRPAYASVSVVASQDKLNYHQKLRRGLAMEATIIDDRRRQNKK